MPTPDHYVINPMHVEDILDIVESMGDMHGFCRGNILKYLYRAGKKGSSLEDLLKARDYLDRYIAVVKLEEGGEDK